MAGKLVGVVMEKGWEQIVAVLGVLSCGAAYVPIDPALPRARIRSLLERTSLAAVVIQPWLRNKVDIPPTMPTTVVEATDHGCVDSSWHQSAETDVAYVLFTSGSSGVPKGVVLSHKSVVNTLQDIVDRFSIGPRDSILTISELGFDLSVFDIFGVLGAGGCVVVPDADRKHDPRHLSALITQERVTLWNSVPALMELILDESEATNKDKQDTLRLVLLSGDWIPLQLPSRIRQRFKQAKIISLGGATEAAIWSVAYPAEDIDPAWRSIPYGRPLRNQRVYIFDHEMNERPDWAEGELYIGGAGVAAGYLDDAKRTKAQFVGHPQTAELLYKTGDAARWWPGGIVELIGRLDTQVKINGHRVELGEIEAALNNTSPVRECCVVVDGVGRAARLVAFVAFSEPHVQREEVLESLRNVLPAYMVPAVLHELKQLPLTPNGKVDRRSLGSLAGTLGHDTKPLAASGTDTALNSVRERELAAIWEELLEVDVAVRTAHFFELGGNSYIGVRLLSRVRQVFGVDLGLGAIIEAPRLADFVERLVDGETIQSSCIVSFGCKTGRGAVVLVHPVGGGVFCYERLAALLEPTVDVYAIEATAQDEIVRTEGISRLATVYAERLAKHIDNAPVVIGGWSMGATIAAEMVTALESCDVSVRGIVLMDPSDPTPMDEWQSEGELWQQFQRDHGAIGQGMQNLADASAEIRSRFAIFCSNTAALAGHHPCPIDIPALLVRPTDEREHGPYEEPWLAVLGSSVRRVEAGTDHYQLLYEPVVVGVAGEIAHFVNVYMSGAAHGASG